MHQKIRSTLWSCLCLALLIASCKNETSSDTRLYPVKENARWGYMNAAGKIVITPAYDHTWDFAEGMGRFKEKGKYGFINEKGEVVIQPTFAYADDFEGGYARINIKDTTVADVQYDGYNLESDWTFTDPKGVVFNQTFARVERFKNGIAIVKDNAGYDAPARYATVTDGQLTVQDRITEGLFDFNGHPLAPASDSETGKLGMIDKTETWVVQPRFDNLEHYAEGLAVAQKNNQYGYIDQQGNWIYSRVVPVNQYVYLDNDFKPFSNGLAAVKTSADTYQYINKQGQLAFKTRFKSAGNFTAEGYAIASIDAGTGLIDNKGNWVIKPPLEIQSVANGMAIYRTDKGYYGARDIATQKDIVPPTYSAIDYTGNLLRVRNAGATYGYINNRGDFVIQPQYMQAWPFDNGKAMVNQQDKYFYIDATGRNLGAVPADKNPYEATTSLYAWNEDGKFGFARNGETVIPVAYDFATDFEGSLARVNTGARLDEDNYGYTGGQWGIIDNKGKSLMPPRYALIMPFRNSTALINTGGTATYWQCEEECDEAVYYECKDGRWGLLKPDGTEAIKPEYDHLIPFGKSFLAARGNDWSILDATGNTVYAGPLEINIWSSTADENFDPSYHEADSTSGDIRLFYDYNFIEAREKGRAGIISTEGQWLLPPQYDNVLYRDATAATPFTEGKVRVKMGNSWGAADATGALVIPASYTGMRDFSNGFAAVFVNNHWGFINNANTLVVEPIYAQVRDVQGNVALVQKADGDTESIISTQGKEVLPATPGIVAAPEGFVHGLCILTEEKDGTTQKTVVTEAGKKLFSQAFTDIQVYADRIYLQNDTKWAMAASNGRILTNFDYTWIEPYHGQELIRCNTGGELYYDEMGLGTSVYGGLWGLVDKNGKLRVAMTLSEIGEFSGNLAPARSGKDLDEVGYIDRTGKIISAIKK